MAFNILSHPAIPKVLAQVIAKLDAGDKTLHLTLQFIFANEGPSQAGSLHCLEANEQEVEKEFHLLQRHAEPRLNQKRTEQVGLDAEQLISELLFLFPVIARTAVTA